MHRRLTRLLALVSLLAVTLVTTGGFHAAHNAVAHDSTSSHGHAHEAVHEADRHASDEHADADHPDGHGNDEEREHCGTCLTIASLTRSLGTALFDLMLITKDEPSVGMVSAPFSVLRAALTGASISSRVPPTVAA